MAEQPQVVIFPSWRLSELQRDAAEKKARWDASAAAVVRTVRENANPITFLKNNPTKMLGAATSLATMVTFLRWFGFGKKAEKTMPLKSGFSFTRNFFAWAGALALRTLLPSAVDLVKFAIKNLFRNDRD